MSDGGQITQQQPQQRSDARRNHAALVAAAERAFALEGPDVPLDVVVREAGVGRGTLYRHFSGRVDLAVAVFEEHVSAHEAYADEHIHEPDVLFQLLDRMADVHVRIRGVTMVLAREPDASSRIDHLVSRLRTLFDRTVRRGQEAGLVSPEITADDLLLLLGMVEGALVGVPLDQVRDVADRVVRLVEPAIRTGPGRTLGARSVATDGHGRNPDGAATDR